MRFKKMETVWGLRKVYDKFGTRFFKKNLEENDKFHKVDG